MAYHFTYNRGKSKRALWGYNKVISENSVALPGVINITITQIISCPFLGKIILRLMLNMQLYSFRTSLTNYRELKKTVSGGFSRDYAPL